MATIWTSFVHCAMYECGGALIYREVYETAGAATATKPILQCSYDMFQYQNIFLINCICVYKFFFMLICFKSFCSFD